MLSWMNTIQLVFVMKYPVNIGGVEDIQPIFIVDHRDNDLILGRPRERMTRAKYINEDDGSYTVKIKNPDRRRMAQFCAVKTDHKRNHELQGRQEMDVSELIL
jgi:hypothetical protein